MVVILAQLFKSDMTIWLEVSLMEDASTWEVWSIFYYLHKWHSRLEKHDVNGFGARGGTQFKCSSVIQRRQNALLRLFYAFRKEVNRPLSDLWRNSLFILEWTEKTHMWMWVCGCTVKKNRKRQKGDTMPYSNGTSHNGFLKHIYYIFVLSLLAALQDWACEWAGPPVRERG